MYLWLYVPLPSFTMCKTYMPHTVLGNNNLKIIITTSNLPSLFNIVLAMASLFIVNFIVNFMNI